MHRGFLCFSTSAVTLQNNLDPALHKQQHPDLQVYSTPPPHDPVHRRPWHPTGTASARHISNMASDLDLLLEMGFDKTRAELAVKKTGGRTFLVTITFGEKKVPQPVVTC
jgi:hypothetical protein